MAAPKWPDRPWNALSFNTNSDGILIYPGPDMTPPATTTSYSARNPFCPCVPRSRSPGPNTPRIRNEFSRPAPKSTHLSMTP